MSLKLFRYAKLNLQNWSCTYKTMKPAFQNVCQKMLIINKSLNISHNYLKKTMDVKTYINGIKFQRKSKQNGYILTTHNILRFWEPNLNIKSAIVMKEACYYSYLRFKCLYFLYNNALLKLIVKQIYWNKIILFKTVPMLCQTSLKFHKCSC